TFTLRLLLRSCSSLRSGLETFLPKRLVLNDRAARRLSGLVPSAGPGINERMSRVGSSMVEQRPFKALVAGSSPAQPRNLCGAGLHPTRGADRYDIAATKN